MAMKETVGSLRAYFILAGVISAGTAMRDMSAVNDVAAVLTAGQKAALYIPIVSRLLLGAAFVIAGIQLKSALATGAIWIKKMLVVSGATLLVDGALVTAVFGVDAGHSGIISAAVGLIITAYLHHSVKQLAAEAQFAKPLPSAKAL
ncbi:MAG TPA: hypothetical protein VGM39_25075 [Kofleriaceae bacterium]|jgi:hypothetical protein